MNHETTDDIIDATLLNLRTTPPPTGLEDRLLQTLEAAQPVPHVRGPHRAHLLGGVDISILRHGWTASIFSFRLAVSVGCVAVALLFSLRLIQTRVISTGAQPGSPTGALAGWGGKRSGEIPALPAAQVASTANQPIQHFTNPTPSVILSGAQRSRRTPTLSTNPSGPDLSTSRPDLSPYDQALADALAPSHPAPPLPLTQQERLLRRILSHGDYTQLAELNPTVRSAREAQELADFQNFFPSPKPHLQPDSAPQTDPTTPGDKQ